MALSPMGTLLDQQRAADAVEALVEQLAERHAETEALGILGIADGGIVFGQYLADSLSKRLGRPVASGVINAVFHRDDLAKKPIPKEFARTDIPFAVDEATVVLVDDVLYSGRTVRAALSELFDIGRPDVVELLVLVDRGNRALPIQPTYAGLTIDTQTSQNVQVDFDPQNPASPQITVA